MAQYPIKMLKDENGTPFVPLVAPEAVKDNQGTDWQTLLNTKLEKTNIIAGDNITLSTSGNNITINSTAGGATTNIIDNLNQSTAGIGVLDAHQGYVLKGMIPGVQNNLTSTSTTDALSAYQGYLLSNRVVPSGGTTGQLLVKNSNTDNDVSWTTLKLGDLQNDAGYIKNTDYASTSSSGVIKTSDLYQTGIYDGALFAKQMTYDSYVSSTNANQFISKGTLENVIAGKKIPVANPISGNVYYDSSHYMMLGYFNCNFSDSNGWQTGTLLIVSNFYGNQHYSSGFLSVFISSNVNAK